MSVRLPSGVLAQFATNVELITNAHTSDGRWRASKYRVTSEKEAESAAGKYFVSLERMNDRDSKWGTGENIQRGRITVQTTYLRGGGDAGGGDRQTVMRAAGDDCQTLGDVLENPANYNREVTGLQVVKCTGSGRLFDLPRAEVWETTFDVTWRSDLATTPVITPTEGSGVTLLPIAGEFVSTNTVGDEDVASQALTVDFSDFSFDTVKVRLLGFVKVTAGIGTFRVRLGGTKGDVDGTLVASMSTSGTTYDLQTSVGAAFANPGGPQLLQVTLENDTTSERAYIDGVGVAVLDGDA